METNQASRLTAADLFNRALEIFKAGDLSQAVAYLRAGIFENIYVAPVLLGERFQPLTIWYPGPESEPAAARSYATRFGPDWEQDKRFLALLRLIWVDPLVRSELKSYINLSKSLAQVRDGRQRSELLRERERFTSMERLKRTQSEILQRFTRASLDIPAERPFLGLVMLSSIDPARSVEFFRNLFGIEPVRTRQIAGGYAEFDLHGVHIAIHGYSHHGHGDPYSLGPPPRCFGWGAFFVIRVRDLDRYHENAVRAGIEIIDSDLKNRGGRFFVVKDPSGYVLEITEEELRGLKA